MALTQGPAQGSAPNTSGPPVPQGNPMARTAHPFSAPSSPSALRPQNPHPQSLYLSSSSRQDNALCPLPACPMPSHSLRPSHVDAPHTSAGPMPPAVSCFQSMLLPTWCFFSRPVAPFIPSVTKLRPFCSRRFTQGSIQDRSCSPTLPVRNPFKQFLVEECTGNTYFSAFCDILCLKLGWWAHGYSLY